MLEINKIHCVACLNGLKQLEDNSVNLIVTDPPYNIGVDYKKYKDKREDYYKWLNKILKECERVLKENGSLYLIHYPEQASRILTKFNTKLFLQNWITWHYPSNIGHSKKNFTRSQRTILFYTKGNKFIFNLEEGEVIPDFLHFNLVKNVSKEKVKGFPNQIPVKLIELLIGLSSNKDMLVLDPFMGSGTTAVACKNLKRNFIGFELNPEYVKIANERLE